MLAVAEPIADVANPPQPSPTEAPQETPPLDVAVAATLEGRGRWGLAAIIPVVWLVVLEGAQLALAGHLHLTPNVGAVVGLFLEATIGLSVVIGVRVAGIPGGWRTGLGVGSLRWGDGRRIPGWVVLQYSARFAVGIAIAAVFPGWLQQTVSNDPLSLHLSVVSDCIIGFNGAVVAPLCEELLCRGIILRAVMRRHGFFAGAWVSSLVFGLAHAYEQPTWGSAATFTLLMGAFGMLQCLLLRRTGRLLPGMCVHGLVNTISGLLALAHP